jgi:hypothetical protein
MKPPSAASDCRESSERDDTDDLPVLATSPRRATSTMALGFFEPGFRVAAGAVFVLGSNSSAGRRAQQARGSGMRTFGKAKLLILQRGGIMLKHGLRSLGSFRSPTPRADPVQRMGAPHATSSQDRVRSISRIGNVAAVPQHWPLDRVYLRLGIRSTSHGAFAKTRQSREGLSGGGRFRPIAASTA